MNRATLLVRSLDHYRRTHAGVVVAMAVSTAIIVGALVVGDSVRISLRNMALARLGKTHTALATGERFFRTELAGSLGLALKIGTAPVLQVRGIATARGGEARINQVQVLGVDARFWALGPDAAVIPELDEDAAVISESVATRLKLKTGDILVLRVDKPGLLARDDPLASESDVATTLRVVVRHITEPFGLGEFSLRSSQVPPFNVFVPLVTLGNALDQPGRANMLLFSGQADAAAMRECWTLADGALELRDLGRGRGLELRSPRVFLDEAVVQAAQNAADNTVPTFTYLVNDIAHDEQHCPYAFVSAAGPDVVPADLPDDGIVINRWLADDIKASTNDVITLTYYQHNAQRSLVETSRTFRVRAIVAMEGAALDPDLMPSFPGIADADGCRDWDSGLAIDTSRIRDADEAYWKDHRGTPKAFVSLGAAQSMWTNRFGTLTAVRFPGETSTEDLAQRIRNELDPAALGFVFKPVRQQAVAAAAQSQDMGTLFLSLSFFLLVAALLLVSLLFVFSVEQRMQESGILLSLGFTPGRVRRLLFLEGMLLACVGVVLGLPLALLYNQAVLGALATVWRGAVGTPALDLHVQPSTLATGAVATLAVSALTLWLALRKQAQHPVHELQTGQLVFPRVRRRRLGLILAIVCGIGAIAISVATPAGRGQEAAGAFFAAGALVLASGAGFLRSLLVATPGSGSPRPTLFRLALRNARRRPGRSLAVILLLACGIFLSAAVGVNRHEIDHISTGRTSGTGGFALMGETVVPILKDLNAPETLRDLGIEGLEGSSFVQLRVRDGDDASCLNLTRTHSPRLLAVDPQQLADREAFGFADMDKEGDTDAGWLALDRELEPGVIPGIADQTVITWGLGKRVGDALPYTDAAGRPFEIRLVAGLANSVFQGSILVSERHFLERFPSVSGTRAFLADIPAGRVDDARRQLGHAFRDHGLELVGTAQRLMEFYVVENTYLDIFLLLGALGVLLGSAGLGIVVLRNVLERRPELGLLRATGFNRHSLVRLVILEHAMLLTAGTALGLVAALIAVLPALLSPGATLPWRTLALLLIGVFANGLLWTFIAARTAMRGDLVEALRNE